MKYNRFTDWRMKRMFKRIYTHLVKSGKSSCEAVKTAREYVVVMSDVDYFLWDDGNSEE